MEKRKVDFTDLVFYLAVASKHARLMALLVIVSLVAGLAYYVYKRPVYYSKSLVNYTAIRPQAGYLEEGKKEHYMDQVLIDLFNAPHIIRQAYEKMGYEENEQNRGLPMHTRIRATFDSERNIILDVWVYEKTWARPFPAVLVDVVKQDRKNKAEAYRENFRQTFTKETDRLSDKIKELRAEKSALLAEYDPDQLEIEIQHLKQIPQRLFAVKQKLVEIERVKAKLHSSRNLSIVERLTLYTSIIDDVGLEPGMIIPRTPTQQSNPTPSSGGRRGAGLLDAIGQNENSHFQKGTGMSRGNGGGLRQMNPLGVDRLDANRGGGRVVTHTTRLSPVRWEELERDRFRFEQQIKEASKIWLDQHPKMKELRRQLGEVEEQLEKALYNAAYLFSLSESRLRDQERKLEEQRPEYDRAVERMQQYLEKAGVDEDIKDWEELKKKAEIDMAKVSYLTEEDHVNLKFHDWKQVRDLIPVSPNRVKTVLFSLLMGIALAVGVPFLLEFLDQTVTNIDKLEQETHMRGLGLVPDFEDTLAEAYPLLGSDSMTDPDMIENFRVIRTNLVAAAATSKYPQVIMVTSTMPKEGKTVVSSNLALSFAQMGDKTLYIDTNLRRGLVHHLFSVRSSPGLGNVLIENLDVASAIRETAAENLSVLPVGDHLDGDIEMLASNRMQVIMDELRGKYQRIVMDAPPVLGLSETAVLQPVVDGVVMCIWSAFTSTRQIRTAMDILNDNHANIYGFVLNRLDLSATMNRFHYYYYSNHYYNRYQSMTAAG